MAVYNGKEMGTEALLDVAKHVVHAIYHAPQLTGRLDIQTEIITGEDLLPTVEVFEEMAKQELLMQMDYRVYDEAIKKGESPVVVLIGAELTRSSVGWDCGACGWATCGEFNDYARHNRGRGMFTQGPTCQWLLMDYSIACDWACAAAHQYNIENRIQFSGGTILNLLGHMEDCSMSLALPLGPCKEYWYYNRPCMHGKYSYEEWMEMIAKPAVPAFAGFGGGGKAYIMDRDRFWEEDARYVKIEPDPELEDHLAASRARLIEVIVQKRQEMAQKQLGESEKKAKGKRTKGKGQRTKAKRKRAKGKG